MKKFLKAVGTGQLGALFDDDDEDNGECSPSEPRAGFLFGLDKNGTRGAATAQQSSRNGPRNLSPSPSTSSRNGAPLLRAAVASSAKTGTAPYKGSTAPSSRCATPEHRSSLSPARTPTFESRAALSPSRAVTPDHKSSLGSSRCGTPEHRSPLASPRSGTPELRSALVSSRSGTPEHRFVPLLLPPADDGACSVSPYWSQAQSASISLVSGQPNDWTLDILASDKFALFMLQKNLVI
ncbi:hypothetical protein PoB_006671600 [Plakobranchus ocellatus]|uniref:Uncharacterized protein n=1 Tax=Plakobranchus ocellatus TaxID=259542 RepID=A0AAV4D7S2_9GAST|nr:hypothetical protein PoB_006671600 [Plakobranchus ocellatus]